MVADESGGPNRDEDAVHPTPSSASIWLLVLTFHMRKF